MKTFTYIPEGVCSRRVDFFIADDNTIEDVEITGGCNGNLKGIVSLIKGMSIDDVVKRLEGIRCGNKMTSCPDQIASALKEFKSHA